MGLIKRMVSSLRLFLRKKNVAATKKMKSKSNFEIESLKKK